MRVYTNSDVKGVELCGALKILLPSLQVSSMALVSAITQRGVDHMGLAEIER
jgi:glycerol-3-phosphate dehydrogenase